MSCSFRMEKSIGMNLLVGLIFLVINTQIHGDTVLPITTLDSAVAKGAVCLDGSAPAYSYVEGFGNGSDSWIVFLQGGGMCETPSDCYERSFTYRGSSNLMDPQTTVYAILDSDCTQNPHFCNWHKIYIQYCDGSTFMSNITDSKGHLYYRGARIFDVMMEEVLTKGMRNAKQAILSGSSSSGTGTLLHCDKFRKFLPNTSRVKCISDSGFFLHGKGHVGDKLREESMARIIKTHELTDSLPSTCTSRINPDLCLFPEYFIEDIQTPVFLIESAFDRARLTYFVFGDSTNACVNNLMSCNSTELAIIKDAGEILRNTLTGLKKSSSRGMFIHSCYLHCAFPFTSDTWFSIALANKTMEQAIADWYFDRSSFREIDTEHALPINCTNPPKDKKPPAPLSNSNGLMSSLFSSLSFSM